MSVKNPETENSINNISDTAFWIAGFRALETDRADAVFKDHLAKDLAGERGRQMVIDTPHSSAVAFAMTIRTSAIDQLVLKAISYGVDTVINMAAGLDTRPYRMDLPSSLQWIEIDLPALIEFKNEKLKNEIPRCRLERLLADLSNEIERKELFVELNRKTKKSLVITEGLIVYLKPNDAESLSKDLFNTPNFIYWIQDYNRGFMAKHKQAKDLAKMVKKTPFQFNVKEPIPFFCKDGWKVKDNIYILDEADRVGRLLPAIMPWALLGKLFPKLIRKMANATYGYVMFTKET